MGVVYMIDPHPSLPPFRGKELKFGALLECIGTYPTSFGFG